MSKYFFYHRLVCKETRRTAGKEVTLGADCWAAELWSTILTSQTYIYRTYSYSHAFPDWKIYRNSSTSFIIITMLMVHYTFIVMDFYVWPRKVLNSTVSPTFLYYMSDILLYRYTARRVYARPPRSTTSFGKTPSRGLARKWSNDEGWDARKVDQTSFFSPLSSPWSSCLLRRRWSQRAYVFLSTGESSAFCTRLGIISGYSKICSYILSLIKPRHWEPAVPLFGESSRGINILTYHLPETIDYRCEDRIIVSELRGNIGEIRSILTHSFRKPRSSPPENEPFSQEVYLKISL